MDGKMELNDKQLETLKDICMYKLFHGGNAPTRREIVERLNLSGPSVAQRTVRELIDLGILEIIDRKLCLIGETWSPPPKFRILLQSGQRSAVEPDGIGSS